ncbi:MAG: acyl carrier protein [Sphingomonadaceae bacterium]|uniref:acyl carrier protein n=1 Tax=Thermaurantiacus sp. TaxID=2820283 RepID=UPI00298F3240|nr:acyl carrier protein [Thermaurantiacus sp.]MCS6986292.1 acyl carrier protein [Sphingomonadaceae bacterium]MDW8415741.1 acyl carrier protein [Thermaurantiacus sp.]
MSDAVTRADRLAAVRGFILDRFLFSDDPSLLPDDQSLIEAGILDSMGALELIEFLEERFGVRIRDADVTPGALESVHRIVELVEARLAVDDG